MPVGDDQKQHLELARDIAHKFNTDYKSNFFSPYIGNDVIEMNSIISKYISSATFDPKNTKLIDLLFGRIHTIKAHSLVDDVLKTNFCELESYFQDKNETLIGIIDYEFNKMQKHIIKLKYNLHISYFDYIYQQFFKFNKIRNE